MVTSKESEPVISPSDDNVTATNQQTRTWTAWLQLAPRWSVIARHACSAANKSGVSLNTISPPRVPHLLILSAVTICAYRSPIGRGGKGPSPRWRASMGHGHLTKVVFEKSLSGRARLRPSLAEPARGCCRQGSAGASPYHGRRFQTGAKASTLRCQLRRSAMLRFIRRVCS